MTTGQAPKLRMSAEQVAAIRPDVDNATRHDRRTHAERRRQERKLRDRLAELADRAKA